MSKFESGLLNLKAVFHQIVQSLRQIKFYDLEGGVKMHFLYGIFGYMEHGRDRIE